MRCTLMHKTVPVADMTVDDTLGVILSIGKLHSEAHLPVGVTATNGLPDHSKLTRWWASRSIPRKRSGLRPVLEKLNIPVALALAKESNGLSLSDQYWLHPENSELRWESINIFDNGFSDDIGNLLFGEKSAGINPNLLSPDSTTDGQLIKRWKISGSKLCLIKGGSNTFHQEPLNEAIASAVCRRLGIPHVRYELMWDGEIPYCVCEDFIGPETELVTAYQICEAKPFAAGGDLYEHFMDCCDTLGIPGMHGSLDQMLAVDFLIANTDRHYGNFGAIRNAHTLEWIGPAPLFDNGTSLWCGMINSLIEPDAETKSVTFYQNHADQLDLVTSFGWLDMTALAGITEEVEGILGSSPFINEERRGILCRALTRRADMLGEFVQTLEHRNGIELSKFTLA